jgi:hypothetical protein
VAEVCVGLAERTPQMVADKGHDIDATPFVLYAHQTAASHFIWTMLRHRVGLLTLNQLSGDPSSVRLSSHELRAEQN